MKPNTTHAMAQLICQIKAGLPFEAPEAQLCSGRCLGCPKKVMAFMEDEVAAWEQVISNGEQPSLGDIDKLAKTATKVQAIMAKNDLLPS